MTGPASLPTGFRIPQQAVYPAGCRVGPRRRLGSRGPGKQEVPRPRRPGSSPPVEENRVEKNREVVLGQRVRRDAHPPTDDHLGGEGFRAPSPFGPTVGAEAPGFEPRTIVAIEVKPDDDRFTLVYPVPAPIALERRAVVELQVLHRSFEVGPGHHCSLLTYCIGSSSACACTSERQARHSLGVLNETSNSNSAISEPFSTMKSYSGNRRSDSFPQTIQEAIVSTIDLGSS